MRITNSISLRLTGTLFLTAILFLPSASLAQTNDAPSDTASARNVVPATADWTGNYSYLWAAPTGRTLGQGELLVGIRFVPDAPAPLLDYGLTDRITLMSGYVFRSYGTSPEGTPLQDGQAKIGASLQIGSADAPVAIRAQAHLPINHWLGRQLGDVELMGVRQWGDARTALTAGAGWRGYRSLCRPEWELCREDWQGNWFALGGGYVSLGNYVQLVSENYLRSGSVETSTGVRAGARGFTVGAAVGCGAFAGMGVGADCRGIQLNASYQFRFNRER